jgi:hypothetical protein
MPILQYSAPILSAILDQIVHWAGVQQAPTRTTRLDEMSRLYVHARFP